MKLLWLDTETTGLDATRHKLLEVAGFVSDLGTPFLREGDAVDGVLPVTEEEAASFDPFIIDMHGKNGLMNECVAEWNRRWNDHKLAAKSEERREAFLCDTKGVPVRYPIVYRDALRELEDDFLAVVPEADKKNLTALAGFSVHFDLGFIRTHMPRLAARLSHRVYDVSAVKLFCRSLGMEKLPPEEAHRAMDDVMESVRHAEQCISWLKDWGWNTRRDEMTDSDDRAWRIQEKRRKAKAMAEGPQAGDRIEVSDVETVPRYRVGQQGTVESVATSNEDLVYRIKAADGDSLLLRACEFAVLARKAAP